MAELQTAEGKEVSTLLRMFQDDGALSFWSEADGVPGNILFDCRFGDIPRKDGSRYTIADEWIILAGLVTLPSGQIWGVKALRLRPEDNAIDVLGRDVQDTEYTLLDSFHAIRNIVIPD